MKHILPLLFLTFLWCGQGVCQEISRAESDLFEIHARPLLTSHCIRCHGDEKQEGGLRLTTLDEMLKGGESGSAVEPGKPNESLIMEALRHESFEMPPDGKLDAKLIAGFADWIQAGAPWPTDVKLAKLSVIDEDARDWWCFQPIQNPKPPVVSDDKWATSEIDRFVLAKLRESGLSNSKRADPVTLARRAHFAITGLPPDAETIQEASSQDFRYEELVDRLLTSESYGENQARYWLDLVRYADTDGYRADHARPNAYHYRDYVIRSFNADKPYDRFIREQLAGDEIDPGNRDAHIATMYLRHWIYEHNQRDVETQWHEILSDITETTSDVFLAQGLKCAKCHDHKFDPLLQKDYFRIKAFFAAFQPAENHPVADRKALAKYRKEQAAWEKATESIRKQLHELEHPVLLKHATREGFEKFIPKIKRMIRKRPSERGPYEMQIASLAERQFDLPVDKINEWLSDEEKEQRAELRKQLSSFDSMKPKPLDRMKFVGSDVGPVAPETFIPDHEDVGPIQPGFISLLDSTNAKVDPPPVEIRSTGRRTALADWIASPDNPLTARVIVNRIWQQHFGRGLVETSSDFGHLGSLPSHPELLDWLASAFIKDGWSIKKLHRRILLSATYQQSSRRPADETAKRVDPDNRMLWRMNPRRLAGEEITDAILVASEKLKSQKRAIYKTVKRNTPDPLLAAFDSTDRIRSMGKRHRTTTASQALLLGNGSWAHDRASEITKRFTKAANDDDDFIDSVYMSLFGRGASQSESLVAKQFLQDYVTHTPVEQPPRYDQLVSMPNTKHKAVNFVPGGTLSIGLKTTDSLPNGDFTVEAIVLLRSLYKDATVRTIVTHWNGNKSHAGWSLGVTSTKSAYKPRNLILQLVGKTKKSDKLHYEVVASNLRPELNKPYYVAASVDLDDTTKSGITFYLKDLSNPNAKLQTAQAKHTVTHDIRPKNELSIGTRFGKHVWDGLIDSIRVEAKSRDLSQVAQADSAEGLPEYILDLQFEEESNLGNDSSGAGNHAWSKVNAPKVKSPSERARTAMVHAMLNSNELIYVD